MGLDIVIIDPDGIVVGFQVAYIAFYMNVRVDAPVVVRPVVVVEGTNIINEHEEVKLKPRETTEVHGNVMLPGPGAYVLEFGSLSPQGEEISNVKRLSVVI